jgi:hypothetical protein
MRLLYTLLFGLCLVVGCQKEPQAVDYAAVFTYASPNDQSVKLYFYMTAFGDISFDGFNAKFDIIETDEAGNEVRYIADKVASDTFRVEGLEKDRLYYFKVKAFVGRNYIGESRVVCTATRSLPEPERWFRASEIPLSGSYLTVAPSGDKVMITNYADTSGAAVYYDRVTAVSRVLPIKTPYKYYWNPSGDKVVILAFTDPYISATAYQIWLYQTITQELVLLTPETNVRVQSPIFAPDGEHIQFFSNEGAPDGNLNLWQVKLDGTEKMRIYPQLPSFAYTPHGLPTISWDAEGQNAYISAIEGPLSLGIFRFNTADNTYLPLLGGDPWSDIAPKVSPNGQKLLFISTRSGSEECWLYDIVSQKLVQITDYWKIPFFRDSDWGWLSDSEVFFTGVPPTGHELYRLKLL